MGMHRSEVIQSFIKNCELDIPQVDVSDDGIQKFIQYLQENTILSPDYDHLAGKVVCLLLKEKCDKFFSKAMNQLELVLGVEFLKFVNENAEQLDAMIQPDRDYQFNLFSMNNLTKNYLAKVKKDGKVTVFETPQYMYLRVATAMWMPNLEKIKETYDDLSLAHYSCASPMYFNSGMKKQTLASCFLMKVEDSMEGIADSWKRAAVISKGTGGLGFDFSSLRHSEIANMGSSKGIIPWLKILDEIVTSVDQGDKRKGSATIYLRVWHTDILEFIAAKRNSGPDDLRARRLFYGVWVPNLFWKKVYENGDWYLFCPNIAKGLTEVYDDEFEKMYFDYISQKKYVRKINARELYLEICQSASDNGGPFVIMQDSTNVLSNQKNIGIINSSNLCTEIVEHTSSSEVAVCNLSSLALNSCVEDGKFSFEKCEILTRRLVRNVNQCTEHCYYPNCIPEMRYSNNKNIPLGIGVQGYADMVALLDMSWVVKDKDGNLSENPELVDLNYSIFECMYYSALSESWEIAKEKGPYSSFYGSPLSMGQFHHEMWEQYSQKLYHTLCPELQAKHREINARKFPPLRYDWETLRTNIRNNGVRNSLLIALMPTATSSYLIGNSESFEPFPFHVYTRTVISGSYIVFNKHLYSDLKKLNLWNDENLRNIIESRGSVQNIVYNGSDESVKNRVEFLKLKYLTIYEIPQRILLDLSADRNRFVDQSSSQNCHFISPDPELLYAYDIHAWLRGMKTLRYYVRQLARVDPLNYAVSTISVKKEPKPVVRCTEEVCLVCSS